MLATWAGHVIVLEKVGAALTLVVKHILVLKQITWRLVRIVLFDVVV